MSDLKTNDKPIPADYSVPFFIHEEDMVLMDMSHKRIEKRIMLISAIVILSLLGIDCCLIRKLFSA